MAKPKLALIPATIGDKVYSILPSDGVGDFDFTRGTSATRINAQGLIETVASGENRLNYSLLDGEVVGCPHLLLEPQRTNLIPYSEEFGSGSGWTLQANVTLTSNSAISPDGTLNATKLVGNGTSGIYRYVTVSGVISKTIYIKSVVGNVNVKLKDPGGSAEKTLNVTTQWQRFDLIGNNGTSTSGLWIDDIPSSGIYIWGAMLEEGSYPTSYIKTTNQAVTRAAETCNGSGDAATFNDSEGVLMAEFKTFSINAASSRYITISNGTADNRIAIRQVSGTNNQIGLFVVVGGSVEANLLSTHNNVLNFNKIAIKYKLNDFALWVNGIKVGTDTSGAVPSEGTLNKLDFTNFNGSSLPFEGKTKQLQYFDTTDIDLEQLTSWDSFRAMAEGQLYSIQ